MLFFAGLDISTQNSKLIVIDFETKKTVFFESVNYDDDLPQYNTENGIRKNESFGVSESDPNMWIDAIQILFVRLREKLAASVWRIKMLSVSAQQHGLVTITKEGDLSRPYSKLWNDSSTINETDILTEKVGGVKAMIDEIGNIQRIGYTASKILHMKLHEPDFYANTHKVFLVHNFINWILTGGKDGGVAVMEPGDLSGSALWNPVTKSWSEKILAIIDPGLYDKLPPVKDSRDPIGALGKEFVREYGFSDDCMVASGSGDNMMDALGTCNYKEDVITISLGPSGTAYSFMKTPFVDPDGEIANFCDATGNYLALLYISNLANGYEAILKQYKLSHDKFEKIIKETKPGNGGRILIPWYEGETTPDLPEAAPIYFGFELNDFTREKLCRAVLEGHIMNLYEGFLKLPVKPKEIHLTGGLSKSEVWRNTIANIFNCEVVPVLGEGAALGAALHAGWSFFKDKDIKEIVDPFIIFDENSRVKPDPSVVEIYSEFKNLYLSVSKNIRGLKGSNPFILFKNFKRKYSA